MSVDCFLDTNVFIYQLEGIDTRKSEIAEDLIQQGIADGTACISYQIVQECLNVMSRKAQVPLAADEIRNYLSGVLAPLIRVQSSLDLYHAAIDIHARYRFGFYDALVISAAIEAGCTRLYSEDMQHGQQIQKLTIENPFRL